jgi:hypothetical protein
MQNSLERQQTKIYLAGAAGNLQPVVSTCFCNRIVQKSVTGAHGHASMFKTACLPIIIA